MGPAWRGSAESVPEVQERELGSTQALGKKGREINQDCNAPVVGTARRIPIDGRLLIFNEKSHPEVRVAFPVVIGKSWSLGQFSLVSSFENVSD